MDVATPEAPEDVDRTVVYLGNRQAIEVVEDPDPVRRAEHARHSEAPLTIRRALPAGKRCTTVVLAPGLKLLEAAYDITHPERGVWNAHSDMEAPAWVASTDPALAAVLAAHWGCPVREVDLEHDTGSEG